MTNVIYSLLRLALGPIIQAILVNVSYVLEKHAHFFVVGSNVIYISIRSNYCQGHSRLLCPSQNSYQLLKEGFEVFDYNCGFIVASIFASCILEHLY